jgi:hypothetical protein
MRLKKMSMTTEMTATDQQLHHRWSASSGIAKTPLNCSSTNTLSVLTEPEQK